MKGLSSVGQFALRSLVFSIAMSLVMGLVVTLAIRQVYLNQAALSAQIAATALMSHHLETDDLASSSVSPRTERALDDMLADDLAGTGIYAMRVWARDGRLLYASDGELPAGTERLDPPELSAAVSGRTTRRVIDGATSAAPLGSSGHALAVYAPLRLGHSEKVMGAFEVYESYDRVVADSNRLIGLLWAIIALGTGVAYVTQVSIVRKTAQDLVATQGELEQVDERLQSTFENLELHSLGTLQALLAAVDAKDSYTARHSMAVTDFAVAIGRRLGLDDQEIVSLERASLLHDIGKIGTPEEILLKPSGLTDEEFRTIKEHPEMGGHIIETIPFLSGIIPIVRWHHERWDGSGYPDGLAGESIPVLARILAVADAFDAMTSDRPYRKGMSPEAARAELLRCRGFQFDPCSVDALMDALRSGEVRLGTSDPASVHVASA